MNLRIRTEGTVTVVSLPGPYLDASNHEDFMQSMEPTLADCGDVLLDFDALEAIDSSGLGAVAWARRKTHQTGGELAVSGAKGAVRRAFDLVHLERIVRLFPGTPEAIAGLSSSEAPGTA